VSRRTVTVELLFILVGPNPYSSAVYTDEN
jgi:hypothetical protein